MSTNKISKLFIRGHHASMEMWTPKVTDDSLYLKCENGNENDSGKYAVVLMTGGQTVWYIAKNLSKTVKLFLTLPNCVIKCKDVRKRINYGAGYGLKIPTYTGFSDIDFGFFDMCLLHRDSTLSYKFGKIYERTIVIRKKNCY